jgi:hypothetical protein
LEVSVLLKNNDGFGFQIRNLYYRILYQMELDLVRQKANFIDEKNFYKSYLILMNYITFFLLDPIYKI